MAEARQKANDFCSCRHLEKTILGTAGALEIAAMLGLPENDNRWCTPWGVDVTFLCEISNNGGFATAQWTSNDWILDDSFMQALKKEFPHECLEKHANR